MTFSHVLAPLRLTHRSIFGAIDQSRPRLDKALKLFGCCFAAWLCLGSTLEMAEASCQSFNKRSRKTRRRLPLGGIDTWESGFSIRITPLWAAVFQVVAEGGYSHRLLFQNRPQC